MAGQVFEDLSEEERYLLAILTDESGVDLAEFSWVDETSDDGLFRCYDYQIPWYRDSSKYQIDQGARSIGKSVGITMRGFAFPFSHPGQELLLTAPESIHLDPIVSIVEDRILSTRLGREMLKKSGASNGISKRPFKVSFRNGAKIIGRIPQKDGKGVKGQHPLMLEMDEAQDYPEAGWIELTETLKYGNEDSRWRAHGVTRGVRDFFHKLTKPGSGWKVHRITAMHRPDWTAEERQSKAELYGSRSHPDYRRNILGAHGDASSALFVLSRLMACVDADTSSRFNADYHNVSVSAERLEDRQLPIGVLLDLPKPNWNRYSSYWGGYDVGMTNHPSEILVFGEHGASKDRDDLDPGTKLDLVCRIHLERISAMDQKAVVEAVIHNFNCTLAMDKTGVGLPIYQDLRVSDSPQVRSGIRGYNFSEKLVVGWEPPENDWDDPVEITANMLEYSSDSLRALVDQGRLRFPWDVELLREWQGETYTVKKSSTNPYGRKVFVGASYHTLDAGRCLAMAYFQQAIDKQKPKASRHQPILDSWV